MGLARTALDDVSLGIAPNELITLIGGNGSGKSTLLRTIAGFLFPDRGTVNFNGQDVTLTPPHKRSQTVALVDQDPTRSCASDLTVAETIALSQPRTAIAHFFPLLRDPRGGALRRTLSRYSPHLADLWTSTVGNLSGGERQMLAIATALIRGCDVFLLDEHTAALDAHNAALVWKETFALHYDANKTVIVVTHDLERALTVEGRLVVLVDGRVAIDASATTRKTLSRQQVVDTYIGSTQRSDPL